MAISSTAANMYSLIALLTLLVTFAASAVIPTGPPFNIKNMVPSGSPSATRTCNVTDVKQPTAPTPLPAPAASQVLSMIALGRGTQNYTCIDATAASTPVQIGALASLYDGTCIARSSPPLLARITAAAAGVDPSSMPAGFGVAGHHFFPDATTPVFAMTGADGLGTTALKKNGSSNAPGAANGDVPWLLLKAQTQGTDGPVTSVYRLNTNGGAAPKTCEGQPPAFQKDYSAEYWFYSTPPPS